MVAGLVLAALVLTAGLAGRGSGPWAVALAAVSVLWLFVNQPVEGRILVAVSDTRGLTTADLAGLAGLLLAAWLQVTRHSKHRRDSDLP